MIIPPIGGLGGGLSVGAAEGLTQGSQSTGGTEAAGSGFGNELTDAISSLEKGQDSAAGASQALATGTVADPESAVVTVEDAQMAMNLAAQIRTKATEAAQNVFQTQV